jgi:hypothetical protein
MNQEFRSSGVAGVQEVRGQVPDEEGREQKAAMQARLILQLLNSCTPELLSYANASATLCASISTISTCRLLVSEGSSTI